MSTDHAKTGGSMKLIEVATRRRVAISMLAVTLVLFGLIALKDLKVNLWDTWAVSFDISSPD